MRLCMRPVGLDTAGSLDREGSHGEFEDLESILFYVYLEPVV